MARKKDKAAVPEREGISPALWLVPLVAIIDLLYYFLLSMGYALPTFGLSMWMINLGSVGIQGALLCVLAVSHALDRRATTVSEDEVDGPDAEDIERDPAGGTAAKGATPAKAPAGGAATKGAASAKASAPAPAPRPAGREVFEYPPKVSGGIYADSHIPLGEGRFLKLRTQIARSCLLCDEQQTCWEIVRTGVEQEIFASNIDCKEGLNIES
ncbi:MAG: hypothetical protein FJ149_10405 [Euryarchaeota archaeon]|nr:hypothetical protein [Euryarchaeota archaeon]